MTAPHALVTGGTSGIGRGVVETLLSRGWTVTATGVTGAELEQLPEDRRLNRQVMDVTCDTAVNACVGSIDRLDALVNCAGILMRGEEHRLDNFERVIAVNLTGTMRMCMACYPLLCASHGSIMNIASMLSYFGGALVPAYSASKGGIVQLTKSLAAAWASDGIRVNAVAPGWIETQMTEPLRADPARSDAILTRTPMQRWGRPTEVGGVVAMLLSTDAGFVTGATLPVDGGYSSV